jgi:hypothetical protein
MPNHGHDQNYGKVARLYPTGQDGGRVFFTLKAGRTAMNPKGGYYFISKRHVNYNALVDLLYMAANAGYTVKVSTKRALVGGFAEVVYLVVDL